MKIVHFHNLTISTSTPHTNTKQQRTEKQEVLHTFSLTLPNPFLIYIQYVQIYEQAALLHYPSKM